MLICGVNFTLFSVPTIFEVANFYLALARLNLILANFSQQFAEAARIIAQSVDSLC